MENAPLIILTIVGLVAVGGFVMQFTEAPTTGESYYWWQSEIQKCISTCEDRYIISTDLYDTCVQDCLPASK